MRGYLVAWLVQGIVFLLIPVGAIALYFRSHPEAADRARFVRRTGMVFIGAFAILVGMFIVGETLSDPGGWQGAVMVAAWLVPLVVVTAVAWYQPRWGVPLLTALVIGVLGLYVLQAIDPVLAEIQDRVGPFTVIALFAVASAVGALAHARTETAGKMLLLLGVVPGALIALADGGPGASLALVVALPLVLTGVLFLVSDRIARNSGPSGAGRDRGSEDAASGLTISARS